MVCSICKKFDHITYQHRCSACGLNHQKSESIHSEFDFKRLKLTFNVKLDKKQIYYLELPHGLREYKSTIPLTHYELRNFEAYKQKTLVGAEVVDSEKCDIFILYKKKGKVVVHYDSEVKFQNRLLNIDNLDKIKTQFSFKWFLLIGIFLLWVWNISHVFNKNSVSEPIS